MNQAMLELFESDAKEAEKDSKVFEDVVGRLKAVNSQYGRANTAAWRVLEILYRSQDARDVAIARSAVLALWDDAAPEEYSKVGKWDWLVLQDLVEQHFRRVAIREVGAAEG